jgi:hypothetical protein
MSAFHQFATFALGSAFDPLWTLGSTEKCLTYEDEEGEHLRHNEQPKAPRITFPFDVQPFLRRSVEAKATVTKLKRDTDGHQRWKAPEECSVIHAFNLA